MERGKRRVTSCLEIAIGPLAQDTSVACLFHMEPDLSNATGRENLNRARVLFLCTHNSARSQMAEAFLRALAGERFEVASAGIDATRVHPFAIQAMDEAGIDLAGRTSKSLDAFPDKSWDYVITVCDSANERCPLFPGRTIRSRWSFDDPSQATGSDEDRLETFRRVRDQIHARLRQWLENLEEPAL